MNDLITRELMNGVWFMISIQMLLVLFYYLGHRIYNHNKESIAGPQYIYPAKHWYLDGANQLAISLAIYMIGSTIRAGWVWALLECLNDHELQKHSCNTLRESHSLLFFASAFAITGGVCCMRVMLPEEWRPWSWVIPGLLAIVVPIVVHFTL